MLSKNVVSAILALGLSAASLSAAAPAQAQSTADRHGPAYPGQVKHWHGYRYCWYDRAWRGPGWYRCGYQWRAGYGWGGYGGWHPWHGAPHWGHNHPGHHHPFDTPAGGPKAGQGGGGPR